MKRNLNWHEPAVYVSIMGGPLLYIILALALAKRATIYIGLRPEWFARRRGAIDIGWGLVLLSVALVAVGIVNFDQYGEAGWLILMGVVLFFAGALYGLLASRMVSPQRISDDYIWLKGVHPEFLVDLPHWPYEP